MTMCEEVTRGKQLHVRLTVDEASCVAEAAAGRGMTVSDFVRRAVLRRSDVRLVGRRLRPYEMADVLDGLQALVAHLQGCVERVRNGGSVAIAELDACLEYVYALLARLPV